MLTVWSLYSKCCTHSRCSCMLHGIHTHTGNWGKRMWTSSSVCRSKCILVQHSPKLVVTSCHHPEAAPQCIHDQDQWGSYPPQDMYSPAWVTDQCIQETWAGISAKPSLEVQCTTKCTTSYHMWNNWCTVYQSPTRFQTLAQVWQDPPKTPKTHWVHLSHVVSSP